MNNTSNYTLAYCTANSAKAGAIKGRLNAVGISVTPVSCEGLESQIGLAEQLIKRNEDTLLLITDNFLKSEGCMHNALYMFQELMEKGKLQPVVANGTQDGHEVPTEFDRMSDVIQYMNFWQERYLNMRKEKRQLPPEEEDGFNEKLKICRGISSEIGEFLRTLRNAGFWSYEQLIANHLAPFFEKIGQPELTSELASLTLETVEATGEENWEKEVTATDHDDTLNAETESAPEMEVVAAEAESIDLTAADLHEPKAAGSDDSKEPAPEEEQQQKTLDYLVSELEIIPEPERSGEETEDDNIIEIDQLEEIHDSKEKKDTLQGWEEVPAADGKFAVIEKILLEAKALISAENQEEAMDLLRTAVKNYPDSTALRYQYSLFLAKYYDDYQGATEQLEALLEYKPRNKNAYFLLAELAQMRQDHEKARQHYQKVLELDRKYYGVPFKLAMLLLQHFPDEQKLAFKSLRRAVKQEPDNVEANYHYALMLREYKGSPEKAVQYFKRVRKLDPGHPTAALQLAGIYLDLKDGKKAQKYFQEAIRTNPDLNTEENKRQFQTAPTAAPAEEAGEPEAEAEHIETLSFPEDNETVVLITGATAGIGKATAELLASKGYRLILNGRRRDRLDELKNTFEKDFDSKVILMPFDIRDTGAVHSFVESLETEWQNVDLLINNAGLGSGTDPIYEGKIEDWERMIDTNLKGLLYVTRAILPFMVARKRGHIINVSSIVGKEVYPNGAVYCATKHAIEGLTKAMRLDLVHHNIRVSQVSPGMVEETEFALVRAGGHQDQANIYQDFNPVTSQDVARVIHFIAAQPPHVAIQDVIITGTQQANSSTIDRSGRWFDEEE